MINKKLKLAMYNAGLTHKDMAAELGINKKVFTNKINHLVVNGYMSRFTDPEKFYLANKFNIPTTDIE